MSKMWEQINEIVAAGDEHKLIKEIDKRRYLPQEPGNVYSQYEWEKYREHMRRYSDGREVS